MNRIGWVVALAAAACAGDSPANVRWVTAPTQADHAKFFPIATGSHALDCNACHGSSDSFQDFDCASCHAGTLHQDLDAMHGGVTTPAPGFQPVPTPVTPAYNRTCLVCHANGLVDPTIAARDHSGSFPISAADSHAYGKTVTVNGNAVVNGCAACHVDPGNRANVDCTVCHIQNGSNGVPGPTLPADQGTAHSGRVGTTAAGGAVHNLWLGTGAVGTGSGASAQCMKCHGGDTHGAGSVAAHGQAGPAHAVFSIDPSNANHFVSCDQCHTSTSIPPGRKNPEFNFNDASCDLCHAANGPGSVLTTHEGFGAPIAGPYAVGDPNNSSACLGCHPNGGAAANFSHAWFPIAQADVHNSAVTKCADCHSTAASYQGPPAGNVALIACTSCHNDDTANTRYQNGFTISAVHTTKLPRNIWNVPGGFDYGPSTNAQCLDCHAGNIGGDVTSWSTPLVFRLAQHDAHCRMGGKGLTGGDATHNVNRNTDVAPGVNICFGCHNAKANSGATPWAREWSVASPTSSCLSCHEHRNNRAPAVTCR